MLKYEENLILCFKVENIAMYFLTLDVSNCHIIDGNPGTFYSDIPMCEKVTLSKSSRKCGLVILIVHQLSSDL